MGVIDKAVAWARAVAADDTHGYDQSSRWGVDYDCSSFVISAYKQAGLPLNATYTGDMYADFLRHGFADVTREVNLNTGAGLEAGDVLLNHIHHTAMAIGGGRIVQASINELGTVTGGQRGDQTGREIYERDYYIYSRGWDAVLRYVGDESGTGEFYPTPTYYYRVSLPLLKPGMKSPYALSVQKLLGVEVSGIMDEETVTAVKVFQTVSGLEADGEVGGLTWKKLLTEVTYGNN